MNEFWDGLWALITSPPWAFWYTATLALVMLIVAIVSTRNQRLRAAERRLVEEFEVLEERIAHRAAIMRKIIRARYNRRSTR